MGSEGWSRERWKDGKYWSVYRDDKGRIRARESARGPKGRFRKFPEPLGKPLWRVHGGYTTGEGLTPAGNVRAVKYMESWDEPGEPNEKWVKKTLENTSGQFDTGMVKVKVGKKKPMVNWIDNLIYHGDWATEVEKVDRVELPAGYKRGRWYVEVFKVRGKPQSVEADYWREAYGA